jgi:hypothetical protein
MEDVRFGLYQYFQLLLKHNHESNSSVGLSGLIALSGGKSGNPVIPDFIGWYFYNESYYFVGYNIVTAYRSTKLRTSRRSVSQYIKAH